MKMTLFAFMASSPWLTFFIVLIIGDVIGVCVKAIIKSGIINKHGYPPNHCDSLGNFKDDAQ